MRFIKSLFLVAVLAAVVVPNAMAFRFTDAARNTPTGVTGQAYNHPLSFAGGCNLVTVFIGPGSLPPGLRVVGSPRDRLAGRVADRGDADAGGDVHVLDQRGAACPSASRRRHDRGRVDDADLAGPRDRRAPPRRHAERRVSEPAADRGWRRQPVVVGARGRCRPVSRSRRRSRFRHSDARSCGQARVASGQRTSGRSTSRNYDRIRAQVAIAARHRPTVQGIDRRLQPGRPCVRWQRGYVWSLEGQVPPGVTDHEVADGQVRGDLRGTPTRAGTFNVIVKATDTEGAGSREMPITVASPVWISAGGSRR